MPQGKHTPPQDRPCGAADCDATVTTYETGGKAAPGNWCSSRCFYRTKDRLTRATHYGKMMHCKECGKELGVVSGRGRPQQYCLEHRPSVKRPKAHEPRTCPGCETVFTPRYERDTQPSVWCSKKCRLKHADKSKAGLYRLRYKIKNGEPVLYRRCTECRGRFRTSSVDKRICDPCIDSQRPIPVTHLNWLSCVGCHTMLPPSFTARGGRRCCTLRACRTCGDILPAELLSSLGGFRASDCQPCIDKRIEAEAEAARLRDQLDCTGCGKSFENWRDTRPDALTKPRLCGPCREETRQRGVHNSWRRRSKAKAGVMREHYTLQDVLDRDGWDCHICGEPCNPHKVPWEYDPLAATVDHLVPLSRMGPDIMANVRVAHFACNSRRSNSLPAFEQLKLA